MKLFLLTLLVTTFPNSFKHFKKSGTDLFCLVDYSAKTVSCSYKTMNECRDQYRDNRVVVCFLRKSLKLIEGE